MVVQTVGSAEGTGEGAGWKAFISTTCTTAATPKPTNQAES